MNSMQYVCKSKIGPWTPKCRVRAARPDSSSDHPLRLPGGEYWWLNSYRNKKCVQIIYGDQFVIERPKIGGEGLTLAGPTDVVVQHHAREDTALSTVKGRTQEALSVFVPGISQYGGGSESVGLTIVPQEKQQKEEDGQMNRHPRRTARVSFTCNICSHRNENRPINPHAWTNGSVFVRCEDCNLVHKLVDNLEIFHEMQGNVFPPKHLRNSPLIQDILDNIREKNQ